MLFALLACWLLASDPPPAGFLVITSSETPLEQIQHTHLRQLYLKKRDRVKGVRLSPVHMDKNHAVRRQFEKQVYQPHFNPQEYWLRLRLQGGEPPPLEVGNAAFMLVYVERNPGFVGYVPAANKEALSRFKVKILQVVKR